MPDAIWEAGEVQFKLTTKLPQKEQKQFEAVAANVPAFRKGAEAISKSAGAASVLFGGIAAFATFMMASSGLRAVLGAFFDLIGMVADLLFVALLPFIFPLLEAFVEFAKEVAFWAKQPGGILGNLGHIFEAAGELFMDILVVSVEAWILIGKAIAEGFWLYVKESAADSVKMKSFAEFGIGMGVFGPGGYLVGEVLGRTDTKAGNWWERTMPSWVPGG